jgi:hypothetical protein
MPGQKVTAESLLPSGIPEDAARMLSERDQIQPEWCTVRELTPQPRPDGFSGPPFKRFERRCIGTNLVISAVAVVRSNKVVITAAGAENGTVKLVRIAAQ